MMVNTFTNGELYLQYQYPFQNPKLNVVQAYVKGLRKTIPGIRTPEYSISYNFKASLISSISMEE